METDFGPLPHPTLNGRISLSVMIKGVLGKSLKTLQICYGEAIVITQNARPLPTLSSVPETVYV